jgi:hypothetical protein
VGVATEGQLSSGTCSEVRRAASRRRNRPTCRRPSRGFCGTVVAHRRDDAVGDIALVLGLVGLGFDELVLGDVLVVDDAQDRLAVDLDRDAGRELDGCRLDRSSPSYETSTPYRPPCSSTLTPGSIARALASCSAFILAARLRELQNMKPSSATIATSRIQSMRIHFRERAGSTLKRAARKPSVIIGHRIRAPRPDEARADARRPPAWRCVPAACARGSDPHEVGLDDRFDRLRLLADGHRERAEADRSPRNRRTTASSTARSRRSRPIASTS